ncbi:cupin domain-containing protein [Ensifer adhaerens]|uniref:cupin domain-containing protein n=1 Tax=Ensifer adhaerens TaxID=106592 RepID=UPI00098FB284|nr:cupin domain-containing protein [Ensifer adhaerens]
MRNSEPKTFVLAGTAMKRLLSGHDTKGQFCLFENVSGGDTQTPVHVHANDDETIHMLEGEMTAVVDGTPRRLTAGQSIFLARGVPHQLLNASRRPARYLLIGTPAIFDRFLEEAGRELRPGEAARPPTPQELDRLRAAAPKFGITLLAAWPAGG